MKITFTGSSLLQILNADADLSRRVLSYDMAGLSFREYLRFYKSIELPVHTMLFLANNVPYDVNIAKLASYLELNKNTVLSYLSSMQRAELLHLLYADNKSVTKMQKPDKIYVHNPNMLCALSSNLNVGTLRECFVVNQLAVGHTVEYGKTQGDFLIDGKITVEVGGQDKSFDQIADIPNSYILADSMEFPVGKKLPLWVVGLLY
jgi:predicted AAA+ superfamily ATPase